MRNELIKLLDNAYAPYSNFRVGSILECKDGKIFKGVNVENASYGASICAERSSIVSAISNGYKKSDFRKIYIINSSDKLGPPCFLCRQVFTEFFDGDMEVVLMDMAGHEEVYKVSELCTVPFDSDNLK